MPSSGIIDSHLHLWDPNQLRYPWLDELPLLNRPYLLDDYNDATVEVSVDKMIFLQCECIFDQCESEAARITELAKNDQRIQGIVPWAPLELGTGARDVLDRYAQNPLIKGVRRIIQFEPASDFCLQPGFIKGVEILSHYNFSFDICIDHTQLSNTIELVKKCPDVPFILDHIGKPDIKNKILDPWKKELKELSDLENVACKISGLVTEADHAEWTKEDLKPYIDNTIECFGFDRIVFGGDWPVCLQASNYSRWVETLDWALKGCSEQELRKIYRDNAERFYRL